MFGPNGIHTIDPKTLAFYHPQFALAIARGVRVFPNMRTLQWKFSSTAVGNPQPASFDQFISSYAVFAGCDLTIDPTGAFAGNVLKTVSDQFQSFVTGMTLTLAVRSGDAGDYTPIVAETPLQLVPRVLNPSAGVWSMNNPDNVKADLAIVSSPPAPCTVWMTFSFLQLGSGGRQFLCMSDGEAREALCKVPGVIQCPPMQPTPPMGA